MCLPDFKEFKQIDKSSPLIGYKTWRNKKNSLILTSEYQDYSWNKLEGPHEVLEINSGIYAYNNYNYNYNNYSYNYSNYNYNYSYNNSHSNYSNYNYSYGNNYYISGIISQWGKVAIHSEGQRSEYAKVKTLFTIRKSDASGTKEFLDWIDIFNKHIEDIAKEYECNTIPYQDFIDSQNVNR